LVPQENFFFGQLAWHQRLLYQVDQADDGGNFQSAGGGVDLAATVLEQFGLAFAQ
jgi:hypothetical protein